MKMVAVEIAGDKKVFIILSPILMHHILTPKYKGMDAFAASEQTLLEFKVFKVLYAFGERSSLHAQVSQNLMLHVTCIREHATIIRC